MKHFLLIACLPFLTACDANQQPAGGQVLNPQEQLQVFLGGRLAEFGHRNWIVIADAAYPAQSRLGIQTVASGLDQGAVLRIVLAELGKAKHVRPVIYTDAELPYVSDQDAPGIGRYRQELGTVLGASKPRSLPHEEIIAKLDKAGEKFHVLVLKTTLTLPYTSIFLELDCGYWSPEAEKRQREAMKGAGTPVGR